MKHVGMVPSLLLILIGAGLGFWGFEVIRQDWTNVSGGPIIWVMYFGGTFLLLGVGVGMIRGIKR